MSRDDLRCWQCGRYAPGGVCVGPHPGFRMSTALAHGNVTGVQAGEVYDGANELAVDYYRRNAERLREKRRQERAKAKRRRTSRLLRPKPTAARQRFHQQVKALLREAQRIEQGVA